MISLINNAMDIRNILEYCHIQCSFMPFHFPFILILQPCAKNKKNKTLICTKLWNDKILYLAPPSGITRHNIYHFHVISLVFCSMCLRRKKGDPELNCTQLTIKQICLSDAVVRNIRKASQRSCLPIFM